MSVSRMTPGDARGGGGERSIAPFSLVKRDRMGRITRVTPLRFMPRGMFPRPNKHAAGQS
jgi:hypothetical protein